MRKIAFVLAFACALAASAERFVTHVTLTTYNAVESQCDEDPSITADGTKVDQEALKSGKQRIVAVSRDLLWYLPYGSVVEIEGHGRFIVADTMNKRFDHYVDILQHESQKNFKKENVKVTLVR